MANEHLAADAVASRVLALASEYGDGLAQVSSLSATMASLDFDTLDALELIMDVEDEFGVTLGGPFDEGDEPDCLLDMPLQAVVDAAVKALVAAHRIEPSGRDLFRALPKVRFALPVHAYLGGCRHLGGGEFVGIHPSVTLDRIPKIPLLMKRASPVLEMCMPEEPADIVTRFTMASYDDPFDRQPKTFGAVAFGDDEAGNPLVVADDPVESVNPAPLVPQADPAPKLTPADIEAVIVSEHYFTAGQGDRADVEDAAFSDASASRHTPHELDLVTVCVLLLRNGAKVTGVNHGPVSAANFDPAKGREYARAAAIEKVWELEGYALRERLAALASIVLDFTPGQEAALLEQMRNATPGTLIPVPGYSPDPGAGKAIEALRQAAEAMRAFTDHEGNMPADTGEFNDLKEALAVAEGVLDAADEEVQP